MLEQEWFRCGARIRGKPGIELAICDVLAASGEMAALEYAKGVLEERLCEDGDVVEVWSGDESWDIEVFWRAIARPQASQTDAPPKGGDDE